MRTSTKTLFIAFAIFLLAMMVVAIITVPANAGNVTIDKNGSMAIDTTQHLDVTVYPTAQKYTAAWQEVLQSALAGKPHDVTIPKHVSVSNHGFYLFTWQYDEVVVKFYPGMGGLGQIEAYEGDGATFLGKRFNLAFIWLACAFLTAIVFVVDLYRRGFEKRRYDFGYMILTAISIIGVPMTLRFVGIDMCSDTQTSMFPISLSAALIFCLTYVGRHEKNTVYVGMFVFQLFVVFIGVISLGLFG